MNGDGDADYGQLRAIPNRNCFIDELRDKLADSRREDRRIGLIVLNVQRFRHINFTLGHKQGDIILLELARRIQSMLRDEDRVYRLGNDEFGILLGNLKSPQVISLAANRIDTLLTESFRLDNQELRIRVHMGGALYPDHATDIDALLRCADHALTYALDSGNRFSLFNDTVQEQDANRLAMESEIERAIIKNEFQLYLQPKIDLGTGKVCGAEALTRWHNEKRGWAFLDQFIPIIEQTDLVMPFTEWGLNAAFRQCALCRKNWDCLSIAVNLSAQTLRHPEIVDMIARTIDIWGVDPRQVVLEVTESAMIQDPEQGLQILRHLDALGVRISIDDFGTGYSSLAYLKSLPVQELKIDKSFVMNLSKSPDNEKIVRTIIDLGHNFDLKIVAEGVEDRETYRRLVELGCDQAQGYHMARSMPVEDMKTWMSESPWGVAPFAKSCAES